MIVILQLLSATATRGHHHTTKSALTLMPRVLTQAMESQTSVQNSALYLANLWQIALLIDQSPLPEPKNTNWLATCGSM